MSLSVLGYRFDNEEHGGEFHQGPGIHREVQEAGYTYATVILAAKALPRKPKGARASA